MLPGQSQPSGTAKELRMNLKKDSYVSPGSLQVSDQGNIACFQEVVELPGRAPEPPIYHILELGSGKDTEVGKVVKDAVSCHISADGQWAVLEGNGLHLLNLANMRSTRIAPEGSGGFWMGRMVIIVSFHEGGSGRLGLMISALKVYDPATGKTEKWKVAGLPLASDPEGKVLLVATNRKAAQEEFGEESPQSMICVDSSGRIHEGIGPFIDFGAGPVISPSRKWIAFQARPKQATNGKEDRKKVTLFDVDKKSTTSIEEPGEPIGVTDSGVLVLIGESAWLQGALIRSYRDGTVRTIVEKAFAATVANKKVYYITGRGDRAGLTWIPVDN
jgi:hypothetical protein